MRLQLPTHQWHLPPENVISQRWRGQPALLSTDMALHVQLWPLAAIKLPVGKYLIPQQPVVPAS